MKYMQYDFDRTCWHIIFHECHGDRQDAHYDVTFCDGIHDLISLDDSTIVSEQPIDELTSCICESCVAEILSLHFYPPKNWMQWYDGTMKHSWWAEHWNTMPEEEKAKYVNIALGYIGARV